MINNKTISTFNYNKQKMLPNEWMKTYKNCRLYTVNMDIKNIIHRLIIYINRYLQNNILLRGLVLDVMKPITDKYRLYNAAVQSLKNFFTH